MSQLLDLDDLLLAVRSPEARTHINDAVICYRSGALRPAVVSIWTAVVFDIIGKVRELELTGDAKAQAFIAKFEQVRATNDLKASLDLERSILDEARDTFELLTHQEFEDLDRLRFDRHRCAHPAMNTSDDAYQPAAELVRYHLRSAITHLLAHPPVQGKAALSRLHQEVESPLFPTTAAGALRVLRGGPLQRPKPALLRDFVVSTLKVVLLDATRGADDAFVARAVAALLAASQLHPAAVAGVYASDLTRVLKAVRDEHLARVVGLGVHLDAVWAHMPDEVRVKLDQLIETASSKSSPGLFRAALSTATLRARAEERIRGFSRLELGALIDEAPLAAAGSPAVVSSGLDLLARSASFDAANTTIQRILLPLASAITAPEFERLVSIADTNGQVEHAFEMYGLLKAIRDSGAIDPSQFRDTLSRSALTSRLTELGREPGTDEAGPAGDEEDIVDEASRGVAVARPLFPAELQVGMRIRHPNFGDGTVTALLGQGVDLKARIEFDDEMVGMKTLVAGQARLTALGEPSRPR